MKKKKSRIPTEEKNLRRIQKLQSICQNYANELIQEIEIQVYKIRIILNTLQKTEARFKKITDNNIEEIINEYRKETKEIVSQFLGFAQLDRSKFDQKKETEIIEATYHSEDIFNTIYINRVKISLNSFIIIEDEVIFYD